MCTIHSTSSEVARQDRLLGVRPGNPSDSGGKGICFDAWDGVVAEESYIGDYSNKVLHMCAKRDMHVMSFGVKSRRQNPYVYMILEKKSEKVGTSPQ
mgnify:CR=1 FL=1